MKPQQASVDVLEGNKIIAFFMGATAVIGTKEWLWFDKYHDNKKSWKPEGLKYHSSFDWLMPVVEKIGNTIIRTGNIPPICKNRNKRGRLYTNIKPE